MPSALRQISTFPFLQYYRLSRLKCERSFGSQRLRQSTTCWTAALCQRRTFSSETSMISMWCPRVVFGGVQEPYNLTEGSVDINVSSGMIQACFPRETKEQAQARCMKGNSTSTFFVDLSERHSNSESLCLSPGLIDVHTHISSLGRNWEGYTTATQAAVAGGITTIIGMPLNSLPPTVSADVVEQELEYARNHSQLFVDVGLWGGVLPETASLTEQLKELLSHPNILGLKAFLSPLPPDAGYQAVAPEQLLNVAKICGTFDKPILVHSELMTTNDIENAMLNAFPDDGSMDNSHEAHVRSRPPEWEQEAVKLVVEATKYCDMHVVHLSDALGCLPIIEKAKRWNLNRRRLTVETCPHYLLLESSMVEDGDTRLKCFPPIRDSNQRKALWRGLESGLIDMVASDHSPCEPEMRQHSIRNAWGGLSGLQYQLLATWTAANQMDQMDVTEIDIAKWWSRNPAGLAGLSDRGSIEPGKRSDFAVWDTASIDMPDDCSKEYHRWKGDCYFSTQKLQGRVLETWLGGIQVYDGIKDELICDRGSYIEYSRS